MAKSTDVTMFIGEDHQFDFTILNEAEDTAIDIASWSLSWMVKRKLSHDDADAIVEKTVGGGGIAITGTFNADPDVNTQKAVVTVVDTDTDALNAGDYHYELKRMDDGFETVLAYGVLELTRGVHRT